MVACVVFGSSIVVAIDAKLPQDLSGQCTAHGLSLCQWLTTTSLSSQNPKDKAAIANAFKYATGLSLVILSAFGKFAKDLNTDDGEDGGYFWAYVACYTFSTLYSWAWDVFMDWGLLICKRPEQTKKVKCHSVGM